MVIRKKSKDEIFIQESEECIDSENVLGNTESP